VSEKSDLESKYIIFRSDIHGYYGAKSSPMVVTFKVSKRLQVSRDCLSGLVDRVPGHSNRGPGFDFAPLPYLLRSSVSGTDSTHLLEDN
jgi:hypothetical protein